MDDIVSYYNTLKYIHDQLKQNYVLSQTYKLEFEKLKTFSDEIRLSREDGWRQCNRSKNRYKDILPYDKHRVRLPEINNIMGSDYINASYIAGPAGFCGYIASQGPLPNTVFDFWRMVWYEHVTAIVMVCREVEMGRVKCANYWGQQAGELQKWGNFQVQLIEEDKRTTFVIRKLVITCAGVTREVHQYQYLQWPDRDVPTDPIPLHEMMHIVREQCPEKSTENNNPVVVHCSAGCGRTGTVMSIDFVHVCIKQQLLDKQFSVFEMVRNMREHRLAICQTKQQYGFVYESALQLLDGALSTLNIRLEAVSASIYENVPSSPSYNTAIFHDDVNPIVDVVPPIPPPKSGQHPTKPKTKPTNYQAKLVSESTPPTTPHSTPPTTQPEPTVDHREPVYASVNPFTRTGQLIDIDDEPRKQTIPPYSSGPGSTTPYIPPKPSITSLSSAAPLKTVPANRNSIRYDDDNYSELSMPRSDATGDSPSAQNTSEEEEEDIYETIDTVPSTTAKKDDTLTRTAKLTVAGKKFKGFKGFIASTKDSVLSSMSDTAHSASHNLKQSASQNLKKPRSFTPGTSPVPAVRNSAKHIAATDIPEFEFGKRTARPKGPRDMPSHWLTT